MKLAEAKAIAADPARHPDKLRLARLVLGNAALRAFPSSPRQQELQALEQRITAMPKWMWMPRQLMTSDERAQAEAHDTKG